MLPYLGVVIDGAEDWLKAIKNSSKCKFCMPLFNESQTIFYEQIRNSIKMWQQDYNEIYISLGNAYRKMMIILEVSVSQLPKFLSYMIYMEWIL